MGADSDQGLIMQMGLMACNVRANGLQLQRVAFYNLEAAKKEEEENTEQTRLRNK